MSVVAGNAIHPSRQLNRPKPQVEIVIDDGSNHIDQNSNGDSSTTDNVGGSGSSPNHDDSRSEPPLSFSSSSSPTFPTVNNSSESNSEDIGTNNINSDNEVESPAEDSNSPQVSSSPPIRLARSSRLKGYITLFVSSLYSFFSVSGTLTDKRSFGDWCLSPHELRSVEEGPKSDSVVRQERYTQSISLITVLATGCIVLIYLDVCTGLDKKIWSKMFAPGSKVELLLLVILTLIWFFTTWFTTTIRGIAGDGKDEYNLYFSTWVCCWSSFWTLERWCVSSGRASFSIFVSSWPNRGPAWIVTFFVSLANFLFVLDLSRHWEEGTKAHPYAASVYGGVSNAEWALLLFVTSITFLVSLAWALAEIFRENRLNTESVKSDVENYIEGLILHILTLIWVATVCIVTLPGGAASLLGNQYFTTWCSSFSVVGTLVWWLRDWRKGIFNVIQKQQQEYEMAKRAVRRREEKRAGKRMRQLDVANGVGAGGMATTPTVGATDASVGTNGETVVREEEDRDTRAKRWFRPLKSSPLGTVSEGDDIIDQSTFRINNHLNDSGINDGDGISEQVVVEGIHDDTTLSMESSNSNHFHSGTNNRARADTGTSSVTMTSVCPDSGVSCTSRSLYVSTISSLDGLENKDVEND